MVNTSSAGNATVQLCKFVYLKDVETNWVDYDAKHGSVETYDYVDSQFVNVDQNAASYKQTATVMNLYDPAEVIYNGGDISKLNCNAIYELELSLYNLTNFYVALNAIRSTNVNEKL